jgi:hypothetical protein
MYVPWSKLTTTVLQTRRIMGATCDAGHNNTTKHFELLASHIS